MALGLNHQVLKLLWLLLLVLAEEDQVTVNLVVLEVLHKDRLMLLMYHQCQSLLVILAVAQTTLDVVAVAILHRLDHTVLDQVVLVQTVINSTQVDMVATDQVVL
jgi:hypothetical protein